MASTSKDHEYRARQLEDFESSESSCSDTDESDSDESDSCEGDEAAVRHDDSDSEHEVNMGFDRPFQWNDMDSYEGMREIFFGPYGPQNEARNVNSILSSFLLFFSQDLVQQIAIETNIYAEDHTPSGISRLSPQTQWEPVTVDELYIVFGLLLLMGIIEKPTLKSYFSTHHLISTPGFRGVMARNRFEQILKYIHFSNNKATNYQGPPKLQKIYPVYSYLNNKFQKLYLPKQDIFIDESLTLWKGRLGFKQYLPLKTSKFGMKTYELCESKTGYLWSILIYTGNDTELNFSVRENAETNVTANIVLHLAEPLLSKGHTIWLDNFYNSPALARLLKENETDCVGTLNTNRKGVSKKIKDCKLQKGQIIGEHAGPVVVMKWCDKRCVTLISTYHNTDMKTEVIRGKEIQKPICVHDYNIYMGGVNRKDQFLQPFLSEQKKTKKWYLKLFRRLLNATVLNSMIIYRHNVTSSISQQEFRIILIEELFINFGDHINKQRATTLTNVVPRLTERHFIRKIAPTGKKSNPQRRCVVCTKNGRKKDTRYCCVNCDVGLCIDDCFEIYHTILHF